MNWKDKNNTRLITAILATQTRDETERFLTDLMTPAEIEEFSKRLRAAELLSRSIKYSAIEEETGLSSTTVARVSKFLKGKAGGYKTILRKLHHKTTNQSRRGLS
ncbi:MAG TPA: YerC/YecD family TrpR-related protein [Candidatus Paceibacterota bacterium]